MRATRRCWGIASIAGFLAVASAAFGRPILLISAAGLGAWLLGMQYSFARGVAMVSQKLVVDHSISPTHGRTNETFNATVALRSAVDSPLQLSVELSPPSTAQRLDSVSKPDCTLAVGETRASAVVAFECSVAGTTTFESPRVAVTGRLGLFTESFEQGPSRTVTVEPPAPSDVHVGRGGTISATHGEHQLGVQGIGFDLKDIREYVPSDPVSRIDWRTTARVGSPHVVEYEPEVDVKTVLIFDRRPRMYIGDPGRTKLDYNREVALTLVESVERASDPLGFYLLDQHSPAAVLDPSASPERYRAVRNRLLARPDPDSQPSARRQRRRKSATTPADSVETAVHLEDDNSPFATAVRPFVTNNTSHTAQLNHDSLFQAVRMAQRRVTGRISYLIFTDDSDPMRLQETVRVARRGRDDVSLFLTPSALFDWGELVGLEQVAEQYRSFESLRRELDRQDRVEAYEVTPRGRIETIQTVLERHGEQTSTTAQNRNGGLQQK